ncbi:hypothetical protein EDC05_001675 [Coemansia umbellata]|uniref:Velvet domain-containing protein n=1 Tax=Coemansia umbellata TaxID=1424467 RepID=A0ABQ8PRP6_9FUNG|nr:hypothetical protein EDC05_001675 [Coemansia umbellata]
MECRYHGRVHSPKYGIVNERLDPVTVALERLDAHGTPLDVDEDITSGMVVQLILASEDGSVDYELTTTGEQLLIGENSKSPEIMDRKIVAIFNNLAVRQAGIFRFRVRMFNIYDTALNIPLSMDDGSIRVSADALFNDISDVFAVYDTT